MIIPFNLIIIISNLSHSLSNKSKTSSPEKMLQTFMYKMDTNYFIFFYD